MTIDKESQHVREARLHWVPISEMRPAPAFEAQRELNNARVEHLVANFDLEEMGTPTLSHRDGTYWIIDGNHRVEALKRLGFGEDKIQCQVYEGLSREQEAERFLKLNDTLNVDALTKFRVGVRAQRDVESEIARIATSVGVVVTRDRSVPNRTVAVGALQRIYSSAGGEGLRRTLVVIREAFGENGFDALVIAGVGSVIARYGEAVDDEWLIKKLGAMARGMKGLLQKGQVHYLSTGYPKHICVGGAVVDAYNKGRGASTKLTGWWK